MKDKRSNADADAEQHQRKHKRNDEFAEHGSIKCTAKRMDDNGGSSEIDEKRRHLSGAGICHELIFVTDCTDTDEQKHDGNLRV